MKLIRTWGMRLFSAQLKGRPQLWWQEHKVFNLCHSDLSYGSKNIRHLGHVGHSRLLVSKNIFHLFSTALLHILVIDWEFDKGKHVSRRNIGDRNGFEYICAVFNVKELAFCNYSIYDDCDSSMHIGSDNLSPVHPCLCLFAKLCPSIFQRQIALYSPCCRRRLVSWRHH